MTKAKNEAAESRIPIPQEAFDWYDEYAHGDIDRRTFLTRIASLSIAGQGGLDGCLWFNLGGVAGDIESGLWLPLGNYGAVKIDWDE